MHVPILILNIKYNCELFNVYSYIGILIYSTLLVDNIVVYSILESMKNSICVMKIT